MNARPELGEKFRDALAFAATVHEGQVRKSTTIPYIAHLLAVCALVLEHGGDEDEAIAALLHDTLEDQPDDVTRALLEQRFGPRAAAMVVGCTDTPEDFAGGVKPPWRERKERYVAHVRRDGASFARVSLADKLHNVRAILADHARIGDEVWARFSVRKQDYVWYFQSLADAFRECGAPRTMLDEYDAAVATLARVVQSQNP